MALYISIKCQKCNEVVVRDYAVKHKYICPNCGFYMRVPAMDRIFMITDKNTFIEWDDELETQNVLRDSSYEIKLKSAQQLTGLKEAVVCGRAKVLGVDIALAVCDSFFIMGSMGHVVGEKITRMIERATDEKLPVFIFCCSGGARMQEGMISLMQMEKTAAALKRHSDAHLFCSTILTDPTTGGVTASFATLSDVIMAEPNATVGFAGKRVIQQTIHEEFPEGFQTSEFLLDHGLIDGIVPRKQMRQMIRFLSLTNRYADGYDNFRVINNPQYLSFIKSDIKHASSSSMTVWEMVKENRSIRRPSAMDYICRIFDIFVEMKGDRLYAEDGAIVGGIGLLEGQPVTIIANYRGKDAHEAVGRHFGMPMPEGYRKSLRLMKQAEKFNRPIITLVNTQGAYCGVEAEARGQGWAIAQNLYELSSIRVPILVIIIGEGGSGGALATAVGDEVWMLENATYAVLTPEGYASILWRDTSKAPAAAEIMKMTAQDLKKLNIIDKIIPEFGGASCENIREICEYLKHEIILFLKKQSSIGRENLIESRYNRFRAF